MNPPNVTQQFANRIRLHTVRMVYKAKAAHVGSSLSMVDLLAVLYGGVLNVDPTRIDWPDRDRFIISKGHAAAAYYATLAESGFFPVEQLETYTQNSSALAGHVSHHNVPGVELSTGSLGHGLPVGCGIALAGKRNDLPYSVFVMLSDGELDEGSNWEAILFAPQHMLDNLVAIVDYNKIQSFGTVQDVLVLEPLADKWAACRWAVKEIDGHDHDAIKMAFKDIPFEPGKPSVIIAHTVKGKGVSFMENQLAWHYKSPDDEQYAQAIKEIENSL